MYITQEIANRIKLELKRKSINMKDMLFDLEMGINAVSEFSKGKQLSCISLAKIADFLDCSVDYLLGRTDNPNSHRFNLELLNNKSSNVQISAFSGKDISANRTIDEEIAIGKKIEKKK